MDIAFVSKTCMTIEGYQNTMYIYGNTIILKEIEFLEKNS